MTGQSNRDTTASSTIAQTSLQKLAARGTGLGGGMERGTTVGLLFGAKL